MPGGSIPPGVFRVKKTHKSVPSLTALGVVIGISTEPGTGLKEDGLMVGAGLASSVVKTPPTGGSFCE